MVVTGCWRQLVNLYLGLVKGKNTVDAEFFF